MLRRLIQRGVVHHFRERRTSFTGRYNVYHAAKRGTKRVVIITFSCPGNAPCGGFSGEYRVAKIAFPAG